MRFDVHTLPPLAGPDPLAVLQHLCSTTSGELTLLHSSTHTSHSVVAFDPLITLEIDSEGRPHLSGAVDFGPPPREAEHPLQMLERVIKAVSFEAPHPLIGWLGFVSYDIGRTLESVGGSTPDAMRWPLLRWVLFRNYLLHDPSGEWTPISLGGAATPAQTIIEACRSAEWKPSEPGETRVLSFVPPIAVREKVERAKEYIAAGDVYQANLAQRWEIETADPPHEIYTRLCAQSPAPYAGFMRFTSVDGISREVLSASPELFVTLHEGQLVTRPIKGTRPRDLADESHDQRMRDELMASEKDQAELAMIVDLLRNDLGRVSEFGSVKVHEARGLEQHPTVWHTVATIASRIRPDAGLAELLAAICPGGSITGAPKIRAMQIIEELEGFRRALYCGNIGVIGPEARTLTLNIAIRTILMQAGKAHVFAGGGIVADSDAQTEHEEMLIKAGAMLRALGVSA